MLRYRGSRWSRPVARIEFECLLGPCKNMARNIGRVLGLDPVATSDGRTEPYIEWTRWVDLMTDSISFSVSGPFVAPVYYSG